MALGNFLSDNILCLLAYNEEYSKIIRNSISLNLYGGTHRIIASRCYDYLDRFGKPPGDHIADILSDKITTDSAEATLYRATINAIRETVKSLNTEYIIHEIQTFIKRQSLRSIAVELTKALQRDTEESLEEADRLISQVKHSQLSIFDPGTRLSDKSKALKFLEFGNDSFPTGIPELDKRGIGPTRKELILLIANAKAGKTTWLTQLAKMAIIHRLKVAHISLEMSEGRVAQKYFSTLWSISKRSEISSSIKFMKDEHNRISSFKETKITPQHTLQDHDIKQKLEKYIDRWALRQLDNIYIKEFPTGSLTVEGLEAYLDSLAATHSFTPDLLIIDYPDLMKLDRSNLRISIGETIKELRGIAVSRNLALAAVSQSNRAAAKMKTVDATGVAEDYSKIQNADITLTLSATAAEKKLGLARLYVAANRNDEGNLMLVISQNYRTGTFVVDSAILSDNYWNELGEDENNA